MTIDSHLLEALRHAPDRDLAPAPALSEAILKAGRSAVGHRAATPRSTGATGRRWWPWLSGLGGALAAGVVALVVWEQPESMSPMNAPQVVAQNEAPTAAEISAPPQPARERAAEPSPSQEAAPGGGAPQPARRAEPPTASMAPPTAPPPAAPERAPNAADSASAIEAVKAELAGIDPKASTRSDLAAKAQAGATASVSGRAAAPSAAQPALPLDALTARADAADALHLRKPEQLRERLVAEPGRWQWRAPNTTTPQAADAAALAWFDRLLLASAQRWEPHVGPLPDGLVVPWLRDGKLEVELRLNDSGVLWRAAGGPALWQPMTPDASRDLTRRF